MGVQVVPNFQNGQNGSHRPHLRVVGGRDVLADLLPLEPPRYLSEPPQEVEDGLSCARGVMMAFGLQAIVLIVVFGLWKLHALLH